MQCELGDLMDLIPPFEQAACGFMPQVMEMQILNAQYVAGSCEGCGDASRVIGEDVAPVAGPRLSLNNFPSLSRVLESSVVALFVSGQAVVEHVAGWASWLMADSVRELPRPGWARELGENVVRLLAPLL